MVALKELVAHGKVNPGNLLTNTQPGDLHNGVPQRCLDNASWSYAL
jgi:hypothetical protein